jgi:hypothetical protein
MPGAAEQWTTGFIVDDDSHPGPVDAEWLVRHGKPVTLRLTGPAGGEWARGTGGERIELDTVEFR